MEYTDVLTARLNKVQQDFDQQLLSIDRLATENTQKDVELKAKEDEINELRQETLHQSAMVEPSRESWEPLSIRWLRLKNRNKLLKDEFLVSQFHQVSSSSPGGKITVIVHFVHRTCHLVRESTVQANVLSGIKWQIFLCLYLQAKYLKEDYCLTETIDEIGNMLLDLKVSIKFWIFSCHKSEKARPNIFKLLFKKKTQKLVSSSRNYLSILVTCWFWRDLCDRSTLSRGDESNLEKNIALKVI